jgi:4-hydroxy-2-oxoheptanedioate aldolase
MRLNTALRQWRAGVQSVGAWLSLANPYTAEALGHAGFDWVCIDLQHGQAVESDLRVLLPALHAGGATPLVRVASHEPSGIMRALDAGALGVIVPLVNTADEAAAAVAACRYPPAGKRSCGPLRTAIHDAPFDPAVNDGEIACIAMIETQAGLDNLEAILATPGLDALYIGPSDLAFALGLGPRGDTDDPLHLKTVGHILERGRAHGVPVGIHSLGPVYAQRRLAAGFDFVTIGSDAGWMMAAAVNELAAARSEVGSR